VAGAAWSIDGCPGIWICFPYPTAMAPGNWSRRRDRRRALGLPLGMNLNLDLGLDLDLDLDLDVVNNLTT
jgi:hypothetical protein